MGSSAKRNARIPPKAPEKVVLSKSTILSSDRYAKRRDLLSVLLEDGVGYTTDQVDRLISDFMKER